MIHARKATRLQPPLLATVRTYSSSTFSRPHFSMLKFTAFWHLMHRTATEFGLAVAQSRGGPRDGCCQGLPPPPPHRRLP